MSLSLFSMPERTDESQKGREKPKMLKIPRSIFSLLDFVYACGRKTHLNIKETNDYFIWRKLR